MGITAILLVYINTKAYAETKKKGEKPAVLGAVRSQDLAALEEEAGLIVKVEPLKEIKVESPVYGVSFSPDDKLLATADKNGGIRLWNTKHYSAVFTLEGHAKQVYGIDFSPDGRYLVSGGGDNFIKMWKIDGGKLVKEVSTEGTVSCVKFSSDNTVLATGNLAHEIELWGVEGENFYRAVTLAGCKESIYSLSFHPNDLYLASAGKDKLIRLWPLGVDDNVRILGEHTHVVLDISFSSGGNFLASGGADNVANLWKTFFKQDKLHVPGGPLLSYVHEGWVTRVAFSPDEKFFVTASQKGYLRLWTLPEGKLLKIISVFPDKPIFSLAFSSQGDYLAVGGSGDKVHIYNWPQIAGSSSL